jgi:hypothetical protein
MIGEIGLDVAMPLENVHNLEAGADIPKEDQVASIREASDIRAKFRARATDRHFQRRQFMTLGAQFPYEVFACRNASARFGDVSQDGQKIRAN